MRHLRTTGLLIAVAGLALTACQSSSDGKAAADDTTLSRSTTSTLRTTNSRVRECIRKLEAGGTIDDCQTTTTAPNPAAADAIAQFALTASNNAAQQTYDETYDYTAVTPQSMAVAVPSVRYAPLDQAGQGVVGVLAQTKHDVLFVTKSASGKWFCITENNEDGVSYGVGPSLSKLNSNGECQLQAWPPPE
jgi:hypothetical protein